MKTRNYNTISTPVFTIFALIMFGTATINAQPGSLDASFGNGGIVNTPNGNVNYASGMAIQSDGKIVMVGYSFAGFAVFRYNTDGSLDESFGDKGMVFTSVPGFLYSGASAVAIQKDGKIVAGGFCRNGTDYDFALVRYNVDGSLDTSFNGSGIVTTDVGAAAGYATSVAIQSDDKIVVGGYCYNGSHNDFAVVRYRADGSLDPNFSGGIVITPIVNSNNYAASVAIQPDGKIIAAGGAGTSFAVVRYTAFGQLDTSFNGTGKVITSFDNARSAARSLELQWDGKIVAAGYRIIGLQYNFTLVRYYPNGDLDTSFGGTGKVIIPASNVNGYAHSVAIQPDGKILAAGSTMGIVKFALVRVNSNGSLDTTFNGTGTVVTAAAYGAAYSVAFQPDDKIVAAGGDLDNGFVLARYLGGPFRVNGKIAFTSDRNGNREIYVMNSDGTGQVRLTNNNVIDQIPAFSPDGKKIAYVSQEASNSLAAKIKIMNSDGTNQTELTSVTMNRFPNWAEWEYSSLSWSPDGSKIAFDDEGEIFTINVDGSNRTNLTNHDADDIAPAWSPDGSRILFTSNRVGYSTMHTMNSDGSDVKVLPSQGYGWDVSPEWSPTGDNIVFVELSEDWFPYIKTADADGTNRRVFDGGGNGSPVRNKPKWSPDGTKIVYHHFKSSDGDCEIYVKNVNGSGLTQLTNTVGNNGQPSWATRIRQISPGTATNDDQ
ncbi:MAG: hypothetical protein ACKVRN_04470 [Pyrinomonadaceae bacterium]